MFFVLCGFCLSIFSDMFYITFCPQVLDVATMPLFMMHVGGGADVGMAN